MPSALYFLKSIFVCGNHLPRVVMMCDEKEYNPQGDSLLACIITQGRQRCTCQPCAIGKYNPDGVMAHRVVWWRWVGADCTWTVDFVWGELRMDGILFVWIVWKNITERGRGGACVPARVALQGRIHHPFPVHNTCVFGMETPLRGRSGGHTGTAPTVRLGGLCVDG